MTPSKTEHELEELLRAAIADAINDAPGIHVSDYGASMVGRQHAIDVAVEAAVNALPALLAERKRLRLALDDAAETLSVAALGEAFHPRLRPSVLRMQIAELRSLLAEQEATDEQR